MNKKGISNNTLAVLIGLSIIVSLFGVWYSLSRLEIAQPGIEIITGAQTTGTAQATVTNSTTITITTSTVNFGNLAIGAKDDTTDASPAPFAVRNDGNAPLNITINASALFSGGNQNASSYQFKCRADEGPNCPSGSPSSFTNMPTANDTGKNLTAVFDLQGADANDSRFVDIAVSVPIGETGGSKSSTVTFTAYQI
ncbi:hypothetical protein HYS48_00170 [Candidatus Woesearchaeota archaeon]|nr:hypothetical protein [Candidatus Woesearchaeota archaeon]